jgi:hypothetical protein
MSEEYITMNDEIMSQKWVIQGPLCTAYERIDNEIKLLNENKLVSKGKQE